MVPLTIPLLTGPASMSTVVIYADRAQTFWQHAALVGYGVVIALATAVCFSLADPIARVLGKTGINVMTRLMGLILAALAVEVMTDGLGKIFPVWLRADRPCPPACCCSKTTPPSPAPWPMRWSATACR